MIFVTTGTQEPFERLVKRMDQLALQIDEEIIVQTLKSSYKVKNMRSYSFLAPLEYEEIFNNARLVVSHAGMGTIITALCKAKPLIIIPRQSSLKEHRDDHQVATTLKMKEFNYVRTAMNEVELEKIVLTIIKQPDIKPLFPKIGEYASASLILSIKDYIEKI